MIGWVVDRLATAQTARLTATLKPTTHWADTKTILAAAASGQFWCTPFFLWELVINNAIADKVRVAITPPAHRPVLLTF